MKKILIGVLAVLLFCAGCGKPNEATVDEKSVKVTDDLGREVSVSKNPERVVALIGSFADVWCIAGGKLVGAADDSWTSFDLDLTDVKNIGKTTTVSLEEIVALNPDLIIGSVNTAIDMELLEKFEQLQIPMIYFDVDDFASYLHMLDVCTDITGCKDLYQSEGLDLQKDIEATIEKAQAVTDNPTVLYLRATASSIKAKGSSGTVLSEMLADLGCENIADGSETLDTLSLEYIVKADPEYIFIVKQGSDDKKVEENITNMLSSNPVYSDLSAVKNNKVIYLDGKLYNLKPNNRWAIAYENLEKLLYE